MNRLRISVFLNAIGFIGLFCSGLKFKSYKQETEKKMNDIVDDLASKQPVEISEKIINAAVDKAVDKAVHEATSKAIVDVRNDIKQVISEEVKKTHSEIIKSASDDYISELHSAINLDDIRKNIENETSKIIVNDFKKKMNEYTDLANLLNQKQEIFRFFS